MKAIITLISTLVVLSFVGCDKKEKNEADLKRSCVMNGLGSGHCTFTNTESSGTGAVCGKVKVVRTSTGRYAESNTFCSGKVEASSSKKVDFTIPAVNDLCDANVKWTEVCSFNFIAE